MFAHNLEYFSNKLVLSMILLRLHGYKLTMPLIVGQVEFFMYGVNLHGLGLTWL